MAAVRVARSMVVERVEAGRAEAAMAAAMAVEVAVVVVVMWWRVGVGFGVGWVVGWGSAMMCMTVGLSDTVGSRTGLGTGLACGNCVSELSNDDARETEWTSQKTIDHVYHCSPLPYTNRVPSSVSSIKDSIREVER